MIYILLAMLLYTALVMLGAAASRSLNTNLVSAIQNVAAVLIPAAVILPAIAKREVEASKQGVLLSVLGGLCVGLFVLALNKSFTQSKIGIILPIVFGGAILLSTILSYFIFKEKLAALELIGLFVIVAGLAVIIYARATA